MKYILLIVSLLFCFNVFAQVEKEPIPTPEFGKFLNKGTNDLVGKVLELGTNKPVEAASIQLFAVTTDPETGKQGDSLISVVISKTNGDFSFSKVPLYDSLLLIVTSVGYGSEMKYIKWGESAAGGGRLDVGNFVLPREEQQLEGVVVTAARPQMQLGIDKKIFDVSQDLSSKGGTAVDVMKTIPSLSVDLDGNVTFRNSTPTLYVDGRPTTLTLEQIPSDNIDRVELVSNPSAKYDASSGGGILNIILKKDKRRGFNGLVSLSGGIPEIFSSNASLNLRQNKVNLFVSGGYSTSGGEAKGSSYRASKSNGLIQDYFDQSYTNDRSREFKNIRGGFDYFIDNRNTLTLSQGYTQGDFSTAQRQEQTYSDFNHSPTRFGTRISNDAFQFRRNTSQANFTHKFPKDEHQFDASVTVNYGGVKSKNDIENKFFQPDGTLIGDPQIVNNDGENSNTQVTAQVDYANPINENVKIETGLRSYFNDYNSLFNSYNVSGGDKIKLPLSNHYKYQEQVHAAYFTYTNRAGSIGYQLGLRGELSRFDGTLIDSAQSFGYKYPSKLKDIWDALFPSIFLSKKVGERDEVQLNYSRRIRRPSFWQLNPFIDINDPQNIQQGNPALRPEFRNSFEMNYSKTYGSNNNFLVTAYYRNTPGNITRYSDTLTAAQYEKMQNSAVDPNAILNTYINANSENNVGLELVLKQRIAKGWDVTPSFTLSYRKVNAEVNNMDLSNEGALWRTKIRTTYKANPANNKSFFKDFTVQADAQYRSPRVIPQGKQLEDYSVDLSLKKDFFKDNKGSLVFSVNDVFDSRRQGTIYDTPSFYQESYSRWRTRNIRLTFSYRFGDANFQLFNRNGGGGDDHSFDM